MPSNPISKIITDTGPSAPIGLNWMARQFDATIQVFLTGTATFGLEYTLDNIMTTDPANVRWVPGGTMPAGTTVGGTEHLTTPFSGVRINPTAINGTIELRVVQS